MSSYESKSQISETNIEAGIYINKTTEEGEYYASDTNSPDIIKVSKGRYNGIQINDKINSVTIINKWI